MKINLILKKIHIDNWFNDNKIDDYEGRILQANKQFEEKENVKKELLLSYDEALNEFEMQLRNEFDLQHKMKISNIYVEDFSELLKQVIENRNTMENNIIKFYDSIQIEYAEDSKFLQNFTNAKQHIHNYRTYLTNEYTFQIKIKKIKTKKKINKQQECIDYFNSFCFSL